MSDIKNDDQQDITGRDNKESCVIIHKSRWAITERNNDKVYKMFLHDSYSKILKEVSLLRLSMGNNPELYFDESQKRWVCKSDYIDLQPLVGNIDINRLIAKLDVLMGLWETDHQYINLVSDEWENLISWYCTLLQQHSQGSEKVVAWLKKTQGEHFIHGDLILSNVCLDNRNNLIILDYENATLGPLLWDETTLVYSFIENKQYDVAVELYTHFGCSKEMLEAISSIRLAQSMRKNQNISQRLAAHMHIIHGCY